MLCANKLPAVEIWSSIGSRAMIAISLVVACTNRCDLDHTECGVDIHFRRNPFWNLVDPAQSPIQGDFSLPQQFRRI